MIKIFDSYKDFLRQAAKDKTLAGVSRAFAKTRPDYLDVFDPERHAGTWNYWRGTGCWKCLGLGYEEAKGCRWCGGSFAKRIHMGEKAEIADEKI